ncbi:MAG: hypothetical protein M1814_001033 [Vezdaea aestivalis]|nr:MAG: hypothetical protein M1814_001033 [Vezdaea aestivalis]
MKDVRMNRSSELGEGMIGGIGASNNYPYIDVVVSRLGMARAIGAVVFTVASCGYLLANDPTGKDKSGHGHGDESHEEHEEKKEESKEEKDGEEEVEDGDEGAKSEISGEGKESEPSSKSGGEKKESESSSGSDGKDSIPEGDKANTGTREAGGLNTQSGKQEGLSNADTKHSTQPHEDPGKSKKGEGVTETAKLKGTVSRDRPLR